MRQRNTSGYEQHVAVWPDDDHPDRWPFAVADGEETDKVPTLLAGFTAVDPEPVKTSRKDAAAAAVSEEGEPQ